MKDLLLKFFAAKPFVAVIVGIVAAIIVSFLLAAIVNLFFVILL